MEIGIFEFLKIYDFKFYKWFMLLIIFFWDDDLGKMYVICFFGILFVY